MLKQHDLQTQGWLSSIRWLIIGLAVFWTALIGASLAWNLAEQRAALRENALLIARTAFQKDLLYRAWNAAHGGLYAPVDGETQPNPYLDGYPGQTITSADGQRLTLINPAYMTRQVFEMQASDSNILGHITSLQPVNPHNTPDAWETRALQAFEETEAVEFFSVESINGERYFRYMAPLITEESCLKCHAAQGYQVGMARGGISESVRLAGLEAAQAGFARLVIPGHAGLWLFVLAMILYLGGRLQTSLQKQVAAENQLLRLSTYDTLTGAHTRSYFEETIKELQTIKQAPISFLSADMDDLKETNDHLGHAAGDLLLKRAAELLRKAFRVTDFVARTGGDEFIIILPNTNAAKAQLAIERVRKVIAEWNAEHPAETVRISLGVATTNDQTGIGEALAQADARMYADKAANKLERRAA